MHLYYDRACRVEPLVKKNGLYKNIRHWIVYKFHAHRHKSSCTCSPLQVRRLKRRVQDLNTSIAEQTFSWFRKYARCVNDLRPKKNKLLILHYVKKHNDLSDAGNCDYITQEADPKRKRRISVKYACRKK